MTLSWIAFGVAVGFGLYTYVGYPLLLRLLPARISPSELVRYGGDDWPLISISVPAYNEAHQIADTIESLLVLDYPAHLKQILIVSDASDDGTDEIVRSYSDRGVELLRQPTRKGKTAAEQLAAEHLTGEIVVNTDASIRIAPQGLKPLIAPFKDPRLGLTSGRDISVGGDDEGANQGEAGYVGYEMRIRNLETAAGGIVGASGCYYAILPHLHRLPLPASLSRDFAAALHTYENGYLALSVSEATCLVPRTGSLRREYRRKARTIARGMRTLQHKRALLNPVRHGRFAWMLFSHKVCRWLLPWMALLGLAGLAGLATAFLWALLLLVAGIAALLIGSVVWAVDPDRRLPPVLGVPAYLLMGNTAAASAALHALRGTNHAVWEPTKRSPAGHGT